MPKRPSHLGNTGYEMLTGRPPFVGESAMETLLQVRTLEPVPPRRLQPKVPPDLETITLKCLQKERSRRYASALALADDLRHFLAGEPIRARPVGRVEQLHRWCQRKPLVASLVAGVILLLAADFATVFYLLWGAEQRAARTQQQLERVEESFRLAQQAVDKSFTQVREEALLNEPGLQPLRRRLLEGTGAYYQEFIRQREGDPGLREELARGYAKVGAVQRELGQRTQALDSFRRSLELWEQVANANPGNRNAQLATEIARCDAAIAELQKE
jgi:hypothetical protein